MRSSGRWGKRGESHDAWGGLLESERRGCGTILVAEDDEGLRTALTALLEAAGYEVAAAEGGAEALALSRRRTPSLAIVDVRMPDMSGYEVCRALKGDFGAAVPVMFVSGERVESFDRVAGLMIGADDYLVKPFDFGELLARVEALVQRGEQARSRRVRLTARERDVLGLLVDGLAHGEVARALGISPKTVGTHVERIFGKLGVRSRAQAVARALRDELVGAQR